MKKGERPASPNTDSASLLTCLRPRLDDDVAAVLDDFQGNISDAVFIIGHLDFQQQGADLFLQVVREELLAEIRRRLLFRRLLNEAGLFRRFVVPITRIKGYFFFYDL